MRLRSFAGWFVLLCGIAAGWLVAGAVPPAPRHDQQGLYFDDYRYEPHAGTVMAVDPGRPLPIPRLLPDFDLELDVELGEHTEVDVLLRQVEPRYLQNEYEQFDGRFTALRLSTVAVGAPWRTRDEALFGARDGGVELAPGILATIWIEARGRHLRANVAGRQLPWTEADDEYGMLALVAHGGKAAVHRLVIHNLGMPRAWLWQRGTWLVLGGLAGALLLLVLWWRAATPSLHLLAGAFLVVMTWALAKRVRPELALPPPSLLVGILALGVLTGSVVIARGLALVGVLAAASALAVVCEPLSHHPASAQLTAVFGPKSGEAPAKALAGLLRGPNGIHDPRPVERRVFLLGGSLLLDRTPFAADGAPSHLEPLLTGELRRALHLRADQIDVVSLPTVDGYSPQQWRQFVTFYTTYAPQVLVFGVPRDEAAVDPATGAPRSSPAVLAKTLGEARAYAAAHAARLVLFGERDLPADLLAVLQAAAAEGVPLVLAEPGEAPVATAQKLGRAIAPLLP